MARFDINTKNYLSDNMRFAELINRLLYGGTAFVDTGRLEDVTVQPSGSASIRDLLKRCTVKKDRGTTYVIYGIENMQYPIYDAPVNAMWYDANDFWSDMQSRNVNVPKHMIPSAFLTAKSWADDIFTAHPCFAVLKPLFTRAPVP